MREKAVKVVPKVIPNIPADEFQQLLVDLGACFTGREKVQGQSLKQALAKNDNAWRAVWLLQKLLVPKIKDNELQPSLFISPSVLALVIKYRRLWGGIARAEAAQNDFFNATGKNSSRRSYYKAKMDALRKYYKVENLRTVKKAKR